MPIAEKTVSLNEPVDYNILTSMKTGAPVGLTGVPKRPAPENDAIPRVAPKWLKHDRQVSYSACPTHKEKTEVGGCLHPFLLGRPSLRNLFIILDSLAVSNFNLSLPLPAEFKSITENGSECRFLQVLTVFIGQVLNFKAYFLEPVVESADENYRIRRCVIYFYLDDDTFHIIEPRVANSGIPQGVFLKRAKLPKPDGSGDYDWPDLRLGIDFNVYGRVFRIIDSDEFTKAYYANEGADIGQPEDYPEDPFANARSMINMKQIPPDQAEFKNYIEVKLKGGRPNGGLKDFLDNDRRVLRFQILWDDTSYDGGEKFYTLNFFLSDNSVEVKEINTPNNGKTKFPMLLKRQKLAKQPILTHYPGMSLR